MQIPAHGFLHASPEPESVHGGMPRVQSHLANSMCTSSFPAPLNALPRCTHPVTSSAPHWSVLVALQCMISVGWTLQILGFGWVASCMGHAFPAFFHSSCHIPHRNPFFFFQLSVFLDSAIFWDCFSQYAVPCLVVGSIPPHSRQISGNFLEHFLFLTFWVFLGISGSV